MNAVQANIARTCSQIALESLGVIYGVRLGPTHSKRFSSNIIQKCNMAQIVYCAIIVTLMPAMFCRVVTT